MTLLGSISVLALATMAIADERLGRLRMGAALPQFDLPALDGQRMSFDALRGKRVLLLVFASW
jgi:hypothetical protein